MVYEDSISRDFTSAKDEIEKRLLDKSNECLLPLFESCVENGLLKPLLQHLDAVALKSDDLTVISRIFTCIADVLALAAKLDDRNLEVTQNAHWKAVSSLFQEGKVNEATKVLATIRDNHLSSTTELLANTSSLYEGAFHELVRQSVGTCRKFVNVVKKGRAVAMNKWVTAEAPARLDLAGGWSDTPPICYEQGGAVVSLAVQIDYKKSLGCRVKRIPETRIELVLNNERIICTEFDHLMDYCDPNAAGALLKAALFCSEVLPLSTTTTLFDHLRATYKGGLELHTWSHLPHGSGLGGSSVLAGVVIAGLWSVVGWSYDTSSLIHAVLYLEQMLTTGGGWEDQVGGLHPGGVKIASSRTNTLPLQVNVRAIPTPEGFLRVLQKHLVVVFTGRTRLAKTLLQDVLRNYSSRLPEIVHTIDDLVLNAHKSAKCFEQGNLEGIGECLNNYWKHKKIMAPECEPKFVQDMMSVLSPHVYGQSLAGAGGGGFMYLITKRENMAEEIRSLLSNIESMEEDVTVHSVEIDEEGIAVHIENA